jgi:hypothetical protein
MRTFVAELAVLLHGGKRVRDLVGVVLPRHGRLEKWKTQKPGQQQAKSDSGTVDFSNAPGYRRGDRTELCRVCVVWRDER